MSEMNTDDVPPMTAVTAELMEEGQLHDVHQHETHDDSAIPVVIADAPEATAVESSSIHHAEGHVVLTVEDLQPIAFQNPNPVAITTYPAGSRAEFISATIMKRSVGDQLGMAIREGDGPGQLVISSLRGEGVLQNSPLRVGDTILSINGKNCTDMTQDTAATYLRQAEGTLTIVAHNSGANRSPNLIETMVEKPTPESTVGIGIGRNTRGNLEVSKVIASGLFAHSLLNVGDRVIAVNQVPCQRVEPSVAIGLIRAAPRYITIVTETQHSTGMVLTSDETGVNHAAPEMLLSSHACVCTWMIIMSLLIIGIAITRANKS